MNKRANGGYGMQPGMKSVDYGQSFHPANVSRDVRGATAWRGP